MENYREYLPELKSTTIFQDIADDDLIALLEAMGPKISHKKAGEGHGPLDKHDFNTFKFLLRATPAPPLAPRRFKWDMPKFGEPGMMMGEIPSLSQLFKVLPRPTKMPFKGHPKPPALDIDALEVSGEMMTKFYNERVAPAQSVMLRNFLGILAQKVTDVRQELFLLRDGIDLYNPAPEEK